MPRLFTVRRDPGGRRPTPAPLVVDLGRIVLVGLALWTVALLVSAVTWAAGPAGWEPTAICSTGIALGLLALAWTRRRAPSRQPRA